MRARSRTAAPPAQGNKPNAEQKPVSSLVTGAILVVVGFVINQYLRYIRPDAPPTDAITGNILKPFTTVIREMKAAKVLADAPDASQDHLDRYLHTLEQMGEVLDDKAPPDAFTFLRSEKSNLLLNRMAWKDVIDRYATLTEQTAQEYLYDKTFFPDCCGSYQCVSGSVKVLLLLKELGSVERADAVLQNLASDQRSIGARSCFGVDWSLGLEHLMAPLSDSYPVGQFADLVSLSNRKSNFWETYEVPVAAFLEAHSEEIIAEADKAFISGGSDSVPHFVRDKLHPEVSNPEAHWSSLHLFVEGTWDSRVCESLPRTCALLRDRPELLGRLRGENAKESQITSVTVYRLKPQTKLYRHTGSPWRLNVQMGLVTPPGAVIRVGGEERSWTRGKCLSFLDASEHEVQFSEGEQDRFVLNVATWHPNIMERRDSEASFATHFRI